MTDDGCHLLTDLVVWDMKVDFVWFINIKICDIAHIWSIKSQFLLIKITFIQTSIHSKYWQVSTHMPKKTGIGVTFPTLPPQLKHPVMGIIDFLTSFYTLSRAPAAPCIGGTVSENGSAYAEVLNGCF